MDCQAAPKKGLTVKRGLAVALALFAFGSEIPAALAQGAPQCAQFQPLSEETIEEVWMPFKFSATEGRGRPAADLHADGRAFCCRRGSTLVKVLVDGVKTWCGVPDVAITNSKASHEKSIKFRTIACTDDAPHPRTPTLSDAIKTPTVDSATNTKTGKGTFDTLTGNPLAK